MKRILFVCLGNICRSPSAEGVMNYLIENAGLRDKIYCDSAGTSGFHQGEKADPRSRKFAQKRGIELNSLSRAFKDPQDFDDFDYIIVMDNQNLKNIKSLDQNSKYKKKIFKMTDFCSIRKESEVPDPYYSGEHGFDLVLDILEDSCEGLMKSILKEL
jgi:protein-tyrosine phosphatase